MDKDMELLKIQVYVGYYHSHFRVLVSFILGALVAVLVLLMGLFYQNAIDLKTYYVVVFGCFPFFAVPLWLTYRDYRRNLGKVDIMIERVDKGNSLPSVEDMIKGKGIQNEQTSMGI